MTGCMGLHEEIAAGLNLQDQSGWKFSQNGILRLVGTGNIIYYRSVYPDASERRRGRRGQLRTHTVLCTCSITVNDPLKYSVDYR